ncbi:MAG: hypothetical protein JW902_08155 [Syntrophaceae bacterium]|nr:hypothetical protein [Syntrophaceae bacterium]
MDRCFNPNEISQAGRSFFLAEKMVSRHFRLTPASVRNWRYDVKTLADLERHEINDDAFAHLCKYGYQKDGAEAEGEFDFYRICLQDHRILDAVERAGSFIRLSPLLLYIAAHELIHVARFSSGEADFDMAEEAKESEEETVNAITQEILKPMDHPHLDLVLECFSKRYNLEAIFH